MSVAEYLESIGYEDVIVFDDYGIKTLIGVDSENRAVYDYDKMVEWMMDVGDCDYEDDLRKKYNLVLKQAEKAGADEKSIKIIKKFKIFFA